MADALKVVAKWTASAKALGLLEWFKGEEPERKEIDEKEMETPAKPPSKRARAQTPAEVYQKACGRTEENIDLELKLAKVVEEETKKKHELTLQVRLDLEEQVLEFMEMDLGVSVTDTVQAPELLESFRKNFCQLTTDDELRLNAEVNKPYDGRGTILEHAMNHVQIYQMIDVCSDKENKVSKEEQKRRVLNLIFSFADFCRKNEFSRAATAPWFNEAKKCENMREILVKIREAMLEKLLPGPEDRRMEKIFSVEHKNTFEKNRMSRKLCYAFQTGSCKWGDKCRFVHEKFQQKGGGQEKTDK